MSPSLDYAASILLCPEDRASVLDLEDGSDEVSGVLGQSSCHGYDGSPGTLWIELPLQSDDCIEVLLRREEEQLPMEGYAERMMPQPGGSGLVTIRRHAIDWIWKVSEHYMFGPLTAVLSVSYLDRFLSASDLPQIKSWMAQLLAVSCLSLAVKMEEPVVPHVLDLQEVGEAKNVFELKTIHKMEHLVLNALGWRMQVVTAFSFIDYYLHKFNDGDAVSKTVLTRSIDLILSTSKGVEFLGFRPSEVAASVALMALGKHEFSELGSVAACCKHLRKERILGCCQVLQQNNFMGIITPSPRSVVSSVFIVLESPIGVLDAAEQSAGAPTTSAERPSASKRRKIGI